MPATTLSQRTQGQRAQAVLPARRLTLAATSLGFAVIQLDVSVVNVAIRPIGAALGGGISGLQWVVDAYTLTLAALILSAGALADRIGAKRVFVGGFAVFTLASAACGASPTLAALIAARAIQGCAAAVLVPASLSLLDHAFSAPGERAHAVGFWAAGASLALAAGPVVGGALIAALGWRAIFFINAPLGALGIALTLRFARETPRAPARGLDLPGQALGIIALAALAGAVIEGGHRGFGTPLVLACFAAGAVAIAAFLVVEVRSTEPMLPLRLFRSAPFSAAVAMGLALNVAFYGLIFVFSLYFQRGRDLSALETGLAFLPTMAAVLPANVLAGRVQHRFGSRRVIATGALLAAIAAAALLRIGRDTPYAAVLAPLAVMSFGVGLVVPAMTAVALGGAEGTGRGLAAGVLNAARQTGSVIGVAVSGSLLGGGAGLVDGLHGALALALALTLLTALLAVAIAGRRGGPSAAE